MVMMIVSFHTT